MIDKLTRRWIRDASDERAAAAGCRFAEDRGEWACEWLEKLVLYEGTRYAGKPLRLLDWERDCTMRLFGWVRPAPELAGHPTLKGWARRYNQAAVWIAKKNGKTPWAAAVALYLAMGDGEQGQKVFLGSKDGAQVRANFARHVVEMVKATPALALETEVNKTTLQVLDTGSRSVVLPLSGSNETTFQTKEGLNGVLVIDEAHVVDRAFMRRLSRLGIYRDEPLTLTVSTAGTDPASWGKQRFDYGEMVAAGQVEDDAFLHASWSCPQDLEDADLEADPVKWGRMANPAMGELVKESEFLEDYQRSKRIPQELADFKMYRLNIWQRSANPWLRMDKWEACRGDRLEDSFRGEPCWLGLDLSKTRDMTSLVLCFREGDEFWLFPRFWLPESRIQELADLMPVRQWVAAGHLRAIPGEVIQQSWIEQEAAALAEKYRLQGIWYDRTFGEDLTQRLVDDLGIERVDVPQSVAYLAGPTEDLERLVIDGKLRHDGNPVMTWQVGHCEVRVDGRGRKIPQRPEPRDHRTIDGLAAGVLAVHGAGTGREAAVPQFY